MVLLPQVLLQQTHAQGKMRRLLVDICGSQFRSRHATAPGFVNVKTGNATE
jgi:hypothetical protein